MLAVEGLVLCGGDVVAHHEGLGEVFRTLEHGTGFRRPYDRDSCGSRVVLEFIVNALHQWVFGAYHHHVDAIFKGERLYRLEVVGLDGHILAAIGCPSVAWGDEKFLNLLALRNLPSESMFASPAS